MNFNKTCKIFIIISLAFCHYIDAQRLNFSEKGLYTNYKFGIYNEINFEHIEHNEIGIDTSYSKFANTKSHHFEIGLGNIIKRKMRFKLGTGVRLQLVSNGDLQLNSFQLTTHFYKNKKDNTRKKKLFFEPSLRLGVAFGNVKTIKVIVPAFGIEASLNYFVFERIAIIAHLGKDFFGQSVEYDDADNVQKEKIFKSKYCGGLGIKYIIL